MPDECPRNGFSGLHVPIGPTIPQCRLCRQPISGKEMGKQGMERAWAGSPDEWRERAWDEVVKLAASGRDFTSEDVTAEIGLPRGAHGMNRNNAVGSLINQAARLSMIFKVGRRVPSRNPRSHGAMLEMWRGR